MTAAGGAVAGVAIDEAAGAAVTDGATAVAAVAAAAGAWLSTRRIGRARSRSPTRRSSEIAADSPIRMKPLQTACTAKAAPPLRMPSLDCTRAAGLGKM